MKGLSLWLYRCLAGLLCVLPLYANDTKNQPPNVVLIISDDQAWTDYSFMGHPVIRTPRIDRLAEQSALFTRGYVTTSLCRPSLASIVTGLYAHQHRISGNDVTPPRDRPKKWSRRRDAKYLQECEKLIANIERVPTLPRLLAKKAYVSHQSGKWWEGHYSRGGFTAGMTHGDPQRKGRHGDVGLRIGRDGMQPVFDFIDQAGQRPFFVWYAPFLPHTPHNPPERLLKKYTTPDRPPALAKYYAMCEWFDETCGELLDHLDKRGLSDNTLVIYITDNGWIQRTEQTAVPDDWTRDYLPRSKLSPHEMGVRTPVMLRWPGKIKPMRSETLVSSIDLAPTILAACGLERTPEMHGINLLEVAAGVPPKRDAIFGELFAHDIADIDDPAKSLCYRWCITDRWKLITHEDGIRYRYEPILRPQSHGPQLYDLRADPHERNNLSRMKPEVVAQLRAKLDGWWP